MEAYKTLHAIIRERNLPYKAVAELTKLSTSCVCSDVSRRQLSVERAIVYGRALRIDPAYFRPDILRPGEVNLQYG